MVATVKMRRQWNPGDDDARPAPGAPASAEAGLPRDGEESPAAATAGPVPALDLAGMIEGLAPAAPDDTQHATWKLGTFALCRIVTPFSRFGRTTAQIRRDLRDDWLVCVATRGLHAVRDDDALSMVPPFVPVVLSLGEPFEAEIRGAEWLCLIMPRDSCPELGPAIDRCRAAPLASAPGRLLGGFLQRIAAELPSMREAEIPRAVEATRALVATAVSAGATPGLVDDAGVRAARLARVRAIIRQHLRSPDLTPDWLCRLVGISRSQLYRLFEPVGGVVRDIQRERLRQTHRAIADPNDGRTIQEISEELGFPEPTTFSRAFRREFGYAPGALRRGAPPEPLSLPHDDAPAPPG